MRAQLVGPRSDAIEVKCADGVGRDRSHDAAVRSQVDGRAGQHRTGLILHDARDGNSLHRALLWGTKQRRENE